MPTSSNRNRNRNRNQKIATPRDLAGRTYEPEYAGGAGGVQPHEREGDEREEGGRQHPHGQQVEQHRGGVVGGWVGGG